MKKYNWIIHICGMVLFFLCSFCLWCFLWNAHDELNDTQKWLVEHQVPYEIVSNLTENFLEEMKEKMNNTNYVLGELKSKTDSMTREFQFSIWYEEEKYIESYYIRKNELPLLYQGEREIKCFWDIKELTIESFQCVYYLKDKPDSYEISSRAQRAGLGYYEIEVPIKNVKFGECVTVTKSVFLPAHGWTDSMESIGYTYE